MADKNFVVHNGLTVGPLTINATTGDITTSGNLTLSGGGSIAVSNVAVSSISQNDSSISILDTGSGSSVVIDIDGITEHTVDADGVNLAAGDRYAIGGTSVLNATTLGAAVVNSSLTTVGNLTALSVAGDVDVYGNLTVQGIAVLNSGSSGTITLGDEATDKVSFSADVNSDILPSTTDLDLGASGSRWGNVYAVTVNTSGDVEVGNDINVTGDANVTGTLTVGGVVTFSADVNGGGDILPSTTDLDLGATGSRWGNVYAVTVNASSGMLINSAVVATTDDATALAIALG